VSLAGLLNQTVTLTTVTEGSRDAYGRPSLLAQQVTITTVTAGSRDAYGRPSQSVTSTTVAGRIDQQQTTERVGDQDVVSTRFVLYLDPTVTIHPQDRVTVGGITYQVDGEPWAVQGARAVHHLEVPLRLVEA
jgi:hypothetical protein